MRKEQFAYVEKIRSAEKYIDISRPEIQRLLLTKGECHLHTDLDFIDDGGETVTADLRLNITTRSETPLAWSMALKLHDIRIDGIDHESRFPMVDGGFGRGWHRHMWDADEESAKHLKIPVPNFDVSSREAFLVRGLSLLKIKVNAVDHGSELFIS